MSPASRPSSPVVGLPATLFFAALVAVWGWLFFVLTGEWDANEQYSHGWFIPLLAGWVFWQRWTCRPEPSPAAGALRVAGSAVLAILVIPSAAGILIAGAYPDWRVVLWALAGSALLASVALTALVGGWGWVRHLSFAYFFALVAVPWPTGPERWLTQELSLWAAQVATWVLPLLGVAAQCHGTSIDVGANVLGVDDACSGIRSFQSSLMAALFLGELYGLRWGYRLVLCVLGLIAAYALNVARMLILSLAVAHKGIGALERLHDPAGFAILILTMAFLWLLCWGAEKVSGSTPPAPAAPRVRGGISRGAGLASMAVVVAVLLMAGASEGWYWWKAKDLVRAPVWSVPGAQPSSGLIDEPLAEKAKEMLRYDVGFQRSWRDEAGRLWHLIFVEWEPKRMSLHYAQPHLPEECQRMVGRTIVSKSELRRTEANGIGIAYNLYKIRAGVDEFYLMYVVNDDRMDGKSIEVTEATPANRLKTVLAGRRNMGQRSLQLALVGETDEAKAEEAMCNLLPQLVQPAQ
ncbi:MAG: exosortase/archaeosortase family protein [Chthoniobacterales bacterium]